MFFIGFIIDMAKVKITYNGTVQQKGGIDSPYRMGTGGKLMSTDILVQPILDPGEGVNNQEKSHTPTEVTTILGPDSGYTGLGTVTIYGITPTYVGSGITRRDGTDLTNNGPTVTVPAGYYSSQQTKSVGEGSVTGPSITFNSNTGVITASATVTAGYVSTSSPSATLGLTVQPAQMITPSTATQYIEGGKFLTGRQTIAPIPSNYRDTSDATASAADIVAGETAYIATGKTTGTLVVNYYYTGATSPTVGLGNNGDLFLLME